MAVVRKTGLAIPRGSNDSDTVTSVACCGAGPRHASSEEPYSGRWPRTPRESIKSTRRSALARGMLGDVPTPYFMHSLFAWRALGPNARRPYSPNNADSDNAPSLAIAEDVLLRLGV